MYFKMAIIIFIILYYSLNILNHQFHQLFPAGQHFKRAFLFLFFFFAVVSCGFQILSNPITKRFIQIVFLEVISLCLWNK